MKTMYRTNLVHCTITAVEVDQEADRFVWVEGRRIAKKTAHHHYWSTWDSAHAHLKRVLRLRVRSAQSRLTAAERDKASAEKQLAVVMAMKPD